MEARIHNTNTIEARPPVGAVWLADFEKGPMARARQIVVRPERGYITSDVGENCAFLLPSAEFAVRIEDDIFTDLPSSAEHVASFEAPGLEPDEMAYVHLVRLDEGAPAAAWACGWYNVTGDPRADGYRRDYIVVADHDAPVPAEWRQVPKWQAFQRSSEKDHTASRLSLDSDALNDPDVRKHKLKLLAKANAKPVITLDADRIALATAIGAGPGGLTSSEWLDRSKRAGLTRSPFYRARARLIDAGKVRIENDRCFAVVLSDDADAAA